jgi:hypothetical protein
LWNHADAVKAVPYLRSLTNALRDRWLEVQRKRLETNRLADVVRPNKAELIALEEAQAGHDQAEDDFAQALEELMRIDVYLLDPVHGLALIPFQRGDNLAWYVFDLFDEKGITSWRYHDDPLNTRRPVAEEASAQPAGLAV